MLARTLSQTLAAISRGFVRLAGLALAIGVGGAVSAQVTRDAGTFAELQAAVTASAASGDTINLTNDIVVTSAVTLNKSLTIRGNGRTVTVPVPGLDESGVIEPAPSTHRLFNITGAGVVVRIEGATLRGGNVAGGGALSVVSGSTLHLFRSTITRSRGTATGGGGGILNAGATVFITESRILRNSAGFGGGFINTAAVMHIDRSLIAENRSERPNGGGGGGENQGTLFINNTTFSNNQSTEIGGGINNFNGTLFVLNSTFSGNVGYGSTVSGGAIGINNGTVRLVNNVFAYNYIRSAGTVTNPTAFALSDVTEFAAAGSTSEARFNIFHASNTIDTTSNNVQYPGAANGSDNTLFSGGLLARLTDGQGTEIGTAQVFRPFLVELPDGRAGTLRIGSFATDFGNFPIRRGALTGYDNTVTPARVGYFNGSAWVAWSGSSPEASPVTVDQLGNPRTPPNIVRGSNSTEIDNVFMLRVNRSLGGTVSGGSLYGDVYLPGSPITLTAVANSGQQFLRWDCVAGCSGVASTGNPYAFPMPASNLTLVPVFAAQAAGQFTVTYTGNGNTGGSPPPSETSSTSVVIAGAGTLVRDGFTFTGWNTIATGGGTAFAPGVTYAPTPAANLTLHAQWSLNSGATVPGAPTGVAATAGDGQATVTFTAPASNGGSAITGYTVTSIPGGFTATGSGSPITVTGLSNGVAYTFTVTATNSVGTSASSAPSSAVTPRAAQTITFANPGAQVFGTSPTLTATSSSGLPVSFTSSTTAVCTITGGGALSFVTAGACTINADQAGDATTLPAPTVSQTFTVNAVVPGAPTGVAATAGDGQATVTFTAPASNGGSAITGYTVTSIPGGFTATGSGSPITVTGLSNGVAYTFTVTATNSVGTGAASAASNSVTPQRAFATPTLRPDRAIIGLGAGAIDIDVLSNDSIDPLLGTALSLSIAVTPSSGTATVVAGSGAAGPRIRYTPGASTAADALVYRACFGALTPCLDAIVTIERRPLAVSALSWRTASERGFRDEVLSGLPRLPAARFEAHGLVAPFVANALTSQPAAASSPWGGGSIQTILRPLDGGSEGRAWRVLVDVSGEVDLYVGVDANGDGLADANELTCSSASIGAGDRCDLALWTAAGASRAYWIIVHSAASGTPARIEAFETPLGVPVQQRQLVATGPGMAEAGISIPLRLGWDEPGFLPGHSRGGWFEVFAEGGQSIGWVPVRIDRDAGEPAAFPLASGVDHTLALLPDGAHERLFIDVPPGTTRLEASTTSAQEVDLLLRRIVAPEPTAGIPLIASAPRGQRPDAEARRQGGNERLVIDRPAPGRWYITPVNNPLESNATVTVRATLTGDAPRLLPGAYFNPQRPGSGLFLYPAERDWAALWYTSLEDGTPTWYYLQAAQPGPNGVWRSPIFRSSWDGARNRLTRVGEASVTATASRRLVFSFTLDGRTGSDTFVDFGGGCPVVGGQPVDASGHWFDPRRSGSGYTLQLFPDYEFVVVFGYDALGMPRNLVAERSGIGGPVATLPLVQVGGACPLCVQPPMVTRQAVGTLQRRIEGGTVRNITLSGSFVNGVPGVWAANDDVVPLGGLRGCAAN